MVTERLAATVAASQTGFAVVVITTVATCHAVVTVRLVASRTDLPAIVANGIFAATAVVAVAPIHRVTARETLHPVPIVERDVGVVWVVGF